MSQLKAKLNTLRGQSAAQGAHASSLRARLQRARPHSPVNNPVRQSLPDENVAELLNGKNISEGVILVERRLPLTTMHGQFTLDRIREGSTGLFCNNPSAPAESLLFMDTETSGLAGGSGTVVFLLGMARLRNEALTIRQYFLTAFSAEQAMLEHAAQWLCGDETLVSYNGKSFDVPLLATRYRLARLDDPFSVLNHLDLLHPTRRAFAGVWPDCRLSTVEKELLAFERIHDLPGAETPQVWFEFVRFGLYQRLPAVLEHNYWDLITLAALLPALATVYENPLDAKADILAIAKHYSNIGDEEAAFQNLYRSKATLSVDGLRALAWLHRCREEWQEAVMIWQQLAGQGCAESLEHLAKYYEHVRRDYTTALDVTQSLIQENTEKETHLHRKKRLLKKMQKEKNASADRDCVPADLFLR